MTLFVTKYIHDSCVAGFIVQMSKPELRKPIRTETALSMPITSPFWTTVAICFSSLHSFCWNET